MNGSDPIERQDVRVPVYFPVSFREAADPENLAEQIRSHRTCDRFTTPPTAFSDLPADLVNLSEFQEMSPHIYSMWMSLERRIDHIIRLLGQKDFAMADTEEGFCLNISAGGAQLRAKRKIEPGTKLQIRMTPPTFPLFLLEALAVTKSVKPDEKKGGQWLLSVVFEVMNGHDREDLVTYIFKRQREILRDKID